MENFRRENQFSPNLILLDGMSGTGKTMVMRLLDALEGTNVPCFDYRFEQLLISGAFGKIKADALSTLLSLHLDQRYYDQSISREVNFRYHDLSSVLHSSKRKSYLARLFMSDEKFAFDQIKKNQSSLIIVTHQLFETSFLLDKYYRGEVKRILCVRHPYYLFEHWLSCVEMFGKTPRDFTINLTEYGIPWFLENPNENFSSLSASDKAAECLISLASKQEKFLKRCKELVVLDFENFVLNPDKYISRIEEISERRFGDLRRIMMKEKIPRPHINLTRNLAIYRRYASSKLTTTMSHADHYHELKQSIRNVTTPSIFNRLVESAKQYESRFGLWFE